MSCSISFPSIPITCDNTPYIGENGNWHLGDTDTGVQAQGPAGVKGEAGAPGLFTNMDIIFDGAASEVGEMYSLLRPVTDYKVLAVEVEGYHNEAKGWIKGYQPIIAPAVSSTSFQYGCIQHYDTMKLGDNLSFMVFYHFPTSVTLRLDVVGQLNYITDQRISKIYGFR